VNILTADFVFTESVAPGIAPVIAWRQEEEMKKSIVYAASLVVSIIAGAAHANQVWIIDEKGDPQITPGSGGQYNITCSDTCYGVVGSGTTGALDTSADPNYNATAYAFSDPPNEYIFLNELLSTNFTGQVKIDLSPGTTSFVIPWEYFSIKQGTWTAFFQNASGSQITVNTLRGEDPVTLSHYTGMVPLPGAVWLFGSALLGVIALGRRRRLAA